MPAQRIILGSNIHWTMTYYLSVKLPVSVEAAEPLVREALAEAGFGVITEIDMAATFRKKLDVAFKPYKILGACNPHYAYQAVSQEEHLGALLPCNVYLIDQGEAGTEVGMINPELMIGMIGNEKLKDFGTEVKDKLLAALEGLT